MFNWWSIYRLGVFSQAHNAKAKENPPDVQFIFGDCSSEAFGEVS